MLLQSTKRDSFHNFVSCLVSTAVGGFWVGLDCVVLFFFILYRSATFIDYTTACRSMLLGSNGLFRGDGFVGTFGEGVYEYIAGHWIVLGL